MLKVAQYLAQSFFNVVRLEEMSRNTVFYLVSTETTFLQIQKRQKNFPVWLEKQKGFAKIM